jgi:hypothetical protein
MPSFGGEVKPKGPCHKILRHVKKMLLSMNVDISKAKSSQYPLPSFSLFANR